MKTTLTSVARLLKPFDLLFCLSNQPISDSFLLLGVIAKLQSWYKVIDKNRVSRLLKDIKKDILSSVISSEMVSYGPCVFFNDSNILPKI